MTSFRTNSENVRDNQDGIERHLWGKQEYTAAGAIMTVKGTGTEDYEAPVLNIGYSFNVADDTNTEVISMSLGSDTNLKYVIPTIPRDKQRPWKQNSGGIQHPTNPNKAVELNDKRTHLTDGNYAVGDGTLEIKDGKAFFRCSVVFQGDITVNGKIISPNPITNGTETIPGFEA